jgi:hypothetical protein
MPAGYEGIKRGLLAKKVGPVSDEQMAAVKTSAAKMYNATRKPGRAPVTRRHKTEK